jgi:5-formyltetrahydrofolate cyclo-ligase
MTESIQDRKQAIRDQAHAARNALADKDGLSRLICERLVALPAYQSARTVLYYVDVRSEVRTRHYLETALGHGKRIVVPYCVDGELELFLLTDMNQLAVGMYKILEPRPELRDRPEFKVDVADLDLIVVPGVAFDRNGGRTGHGKGYYDKLLEHALAFECQMFPEIPMQPHDVYMDMVVTETAAYPGKGRSVRDHVQG